MSLTEKAKQVIDNLLALPDKELAERIESHKTTDLYPLMLEITKQRNWSEENFMTNPDSKPRALPAPKTLLIPFVVAQNGGQIYLHHLCNSKCEWHDSHTLFFEQAFVDELKLSLHAANERVRELEELLNISKELNRNLANYNADVTEALEFYANRENWTLIREGDFFYSTPSDIDEEPLVPNGDEDDDRVVAGKTAREVLKKWSKK